MVRIMLACAAGMSTSLLVTKMEAAAAKKGVEAKIWAVPEAEVAKNEGEFDVLLIGPQIRYKEKAFKAQYGSIVPVHCIDMRDYGTMNGEKVFDTAMQLIEDFKNN